MPDITITTRRGAVLALSVGNGRTLMEVLREHGEVEAACGGQCVCATCHVHVDPAWMDVIGAPAGIEVDLLDSSMERQANSRLSCQITLSAELDGLAVTVAPAEG